MAHPDNPYAPPSDCVLGNAAIADADVKEVGNLIRDSRLAILVGLIPILGLPLIWRVIQWHLLKRRYPILVAGDAGVHAALARDFRSALPRLWFAVVLWPIVIVFLIIYVSLT